MNKMTTAIAISILSASNVSVAATLIQDRIEHDRAQMQQAFDSNRSTLLDMSPENATRSSSSANTTAHSIQDNIKRDKARLQGIFQYNKTQTTTMSTVKTTQPSSITQRILDS